jgi:hypothetical protein
MRYRVGNKVLDPDMGTSWDESTYWDGHNYISRATGSQWQHEQLHRSSRGTWWIEAWSQWAGSQPSARVISAAEAASWLAAHDHPVPPELADPAE